MYIGPVVVSSRLLRCRGLQGAVADDGGRGWLSWFCGGICCDAWLETRLLRIWEKENGFHERFSPLEFPVGFLCEER